ncbi:hypothetical protein OROGR_013757 [Orobanche gracilis]
MEKGVLSDKLSSLQSKIEELRCVVDNLIEIGSVIVDLGDLEWLVDHQTKSQMITENGKGVVDEMAKLVARFVENEDYKVWLFGTATYKEVDDDYGIPPEENTQGRDGEGDGDDFEMDDFDA